MVDYITDEQLAKNIKIVRLRNDMTQRDVANKLHLSLTSYNKWEKNATTLSLKDLFVLADVLGCTMQDFFMQ